MQKVIMGIQVEQRRETANKVQQMLTDYGCIVKTRLGLSQSCDDFCSDTGLILLEFLSSAGDKIIELEQKLESIEGVIVKKMEF